MYADSTFFDIFTYKTIEGSTEEALDTSQFHRADRDHGEPLF